MTAIARRSFLPRAGTARLSRRCRWLAVALVGTFSANAIAADSFWSLVVDLETAIPLSEQKVEDALGTGLAREQRGQVAEYRAGAFLLKDRSQIEAAVWIPKNGTTPSSLTLTRPAVAARTEACLSRADVSRAFGAPVRSWSSKEGAASYTNFEFAQPKAKVSVAFSDATDCLRTLTIQELR